LSYPASPSCVMSPGAGCHGVRWWCSCVEECATLAHRRCLTMDGTSCLGCSDALANKIIAGARRFVRPNSLKGVVVLPWRLTSVWWKSKAGYDCATAQSPEDVGAQKEGLYTIRELCLSPNGARSDGAKPCVPSLGNLQWTILTNSCVSLDELQANQAVVLLSFFRLLRSCGDWREFEPRRVKRIFLVWIFTTQQRTTVWASFWYVEVEKTMVKHRIIFLYACWALGWCCRGGRQRRVLGILLREIGLHHHMVLRRSKKSWSMGDTMRNSACNSGRQPL
jgi:hypothetical protein